ncbi:MAG TPA: hypothetical protein VHM00_12435 [Caldimonas sp.]|jgi:hypothetical protein|nr:hypothetical protein [Caldimonas sp.]HEX2541876.1 hypothetical protein [Caldimonas sp.]
MTEHTLSAVLTFALLAGGAAAIGSEMFSTRQAPAPQPAVHMVTLPTVMVTGQRQKALTVAADVHESPLSVCNEKGALHATTAHI